MILFIHILNILCLAGISVLLVQRSSRFKIYATLGLLVKFVCGILLGWLYMHYYGYGDTLAYYKEGTQLAELAITSPINYLEYLFTSSSALFKTQFVYEPRALFFTKITSVFCLVSANNYWIVASYFSLLSFSGAWLFAKSLIKHYPSQKLAIILSLFLIPSAVFWSSGIIKESLTFFLICVLSNYIFNWVVDRKYQFKDVVLFIFCFILLWKIKYYYAGVYISVSLTLVLTVYILQIKESIANSRILLLATYLTLFTAIVLIVTLFHPNLGINEIHGVILKNYNAYAAKSSPGNYIVFNELSNISGLVLSAPKALLSGLYRPFIWEAQSSLLLFQSIECLLLLLLTISRLIYIPKKAAITEFLLMASCLMFVFITVTFLAFSAPNFGTLSRYKSTLLPFLCFILLFNHPLLEKLKFNSLWQRSVKH
ncbi:hypothetical protein [Fulvivirga lutea]|uniref:Uncharacterized protein n=1 Tax=Fulvivirga lutea TaxID=2810512 RepID=A0A974WI44_9BACT|nr:hypothetical protein [Fulvivirga lutea]QSE97642.1 hypothetical protein JR347_00720 [Fulvivirga lutea]